MVFHFHCRKEDTENIQQELQRGIILGNLYLIYISNAVSDQPIKVSGLNNGKTGMLVKTFLKKPLEILCKKR